MDIFQTLRDRIVDKLTQTTGKELEISTQITSPKQMDLFIESMALERLGSRYAIERANKMMRLACSWQGRTRTDLTEIGKTPEIRKGDGTAQDF